MATNTAALASRTEEPPVHHGLPARLYLALFAASLLLPALLFSIYLIDRASRQQTAMAEARIVQLAADLADDISGELERGVTILKSLALSGAMERGDYAELHAHAKRIIEDRFALLLLADKDGTQIVNTYVPFGAELARYGDPGALAHVVATGEPYVTDLFFGRTRQTWVVNILWPVKRGGEVDRVLVLSLTADTIHRILNSQFVEPGWTTGVSDRRHVLIARTRLHDEFVGKPLTPELVEASQKLLTPHRITSVDGREIVRAVARTRLGHWTVAAAVDSSVISANVRRSVWDLMLAAAGLMLLSGAVVWVHGRKLAGAIMGLADPARSPAVAAAPVRELNQAAHIQAKALADLRERDEVLRLALSAAYAVAFTWDIPKDEVRRVFSSEPGLPATGNSADTFEAVVAAVHPDDRSSFRDAVEIALANPSELYRNEYRHIRASGEVCWLQEWGRVETDGDGRAVRLVGISIDATARKQADRALAESERKFRDLADSMPQLVWTADAEGRVTYFNEQRSAYRRRDRSNALEWQAVVHPDDLERTRSSWHDAVATGKPYECEHRVQRADGSFRWQLSRARCVNAGGTNRWYGTATDIHDLRLREEQVKLLLREVNHRSKNLLTVVLAIARQTSREGTASAFVRTFTERIQALAACQDLLVNASWQGVDLGELVRIQLAHFGDLLGKRIRIDGPHISISPPAAQAIGMAVHELGTNAMKYGALSNATGEVCITWNLVSSPEGKRFRMSWIETGGPPVPPPERRGFGLVVLERMTPASLSGRAELTYAPEGLRWNVDTPSQYVVDLR